MNFVHIYKWVACWGVLLQKNEGRKFVLFADYIGKGVNFFSEVDLKFSE